MPENQRFKKKVLFRALNSALGYYIFGYSLGIFTSSQDCISSILSWGEDRETLIVLISSLVPLGAFIGSILTGFMSTKFGERTNIMLTDFITIFASIIILYPSTYTLAFSRLLSGICAGSFSILCSQYNSKYTPKQIRGKLGALNQVFVLSGLFSAYTICIPLTFSACNDSTSLLTFAIFTVPGLIASIQIFMFLKFFKKETPLYLILHDEDDQALKAIESIYHEGSVQGHFDSLLKDNLKIREGGTSTSFKDLICCVKNVRRPFRVCLMFHVFSQITGINAILAFSTRIIMEFGVNRLMASIFTSCITLTRVIFVILILPMIDRYGRKSLSVKGEVLMAICMSGITFFIAFDIWPLGKVLFLAAYLVLFSVTVGPIVWIYASEVVPDKGVALCTSANWVVGFAVVIGFPILTNVLPLFCPFAILSMIDIIGAVYLQIELIETKGLNRHEIIQKFLS